MSGESPWAAGEPVTGASEAHIGDRVPVGEPVQCGDPLLGRARWIPSADGTEAMAVHVHRPTAGSVRRALVLAPPIGREQVISYRTLRVLSQRAASSAGALVLRPSWRGTGESTGPLPVDPAAAWRADLLQLIAAAREAAPGREVTVVGLRLGAAVAAGILDAPGAADRTVLWEPVTGRRFVREHQALRRMSVELPESPAGIELPGLALTDEQADALKSLRLPADDVLLQRDDVRILRAPDDRRQEAERMYAVASRDAQVPMAALQQVISLAVPGRASSDPAPTDGRGSRWGADGAPAEERWPVRWDAPARCGGAAVRSEFVTIGPHRLPGVLTGPVPSEAAAPTRRAGTGGEPRVAGLLLLAADAEPMDGPTGLWARTARELADDGVHVLRAERRDIGEAGDPSSTSEPMPYTEEAVADTREAIAWLRDRVEGPVAGAGLCSGAWLALKCARDLDRAILLNNIAWSPNGDYFWRFYRDGSLQRMLGGRERLSLEPDGWRARLKQRLKQGRSATLTRAPLPLLRAATRTGQVQTVGQQFREPSSMPPVDLHLGDSDRESFDMAGGHREVRALQARGFRFRALPLGEVDHALLAAVSRRRAVAALRLSLGITSPQPELRTP